MFMTVDTYLTEFLDNLLKIGFWPFFILNHCIYILHEFTVLLENPITVPL